MTGKSFIRLDVESLKSMYLDGKTTRQIAVVAGVSPKTVSRRLQAEGVTMRPPGPDRFEQLRDGQWLRGEYEEKQKSSTQIAAEVGASVRVVVEWLHKHDITTRQSGNQKGCVFGDDVRRKMSEAKKGKNTGADNPNWRGAKVHPDKRLRSSYETKKWSKLVRERDGGKCVKCGETDTLHAHHVKSWKTNPELRHDVANGVTLCSKCHQEAHGWRFPAWAYHGKSRTSAGHPQG